SFAAGYDDLVPFKARDVIHDLLLSSEIKEVFFEHFCRRNHVLADLYRQATFSGDWPLERENDRDFEIAEQPSKVACVGPYLGPKRLVHLRYEEVLDVYNRAPAMIDDHSFSHSHMLGARPGLSIPHLHRQASLHN